MIRRVDSLTLSENILEPIAFRKDDLKGQSRDDLTRRGSAFHRVAGQDGDTRSTNPKRANSTVKGFAMRKHSEMVPPFVGRERTYSNIALASTRAQRDDKGMVKNKNSSSASKLINIGVDAIVVNSGSDGTGGHNSNVPEHQSVRVRNAERIKLGKKPYFHVSS